MDSLFSMHFHYGGQFLELDGNLVYHGGQMKPKHGMDLDRVGYFDLVDEVERMGYQLKKMCYRIPVAKALREIKDDVQVMEMIEHIHKNTNKMVEVFVEGDKRNHDENRSGEADVPFVPGQCMYSTNLHDDNANINISVGYGHQTEVGEEAILRSDEESDPDYMPFDQSDDTNDDLQDDELSDDEEYVEARKCWAKYKNYREGDFVLTIQDKPRQVMHENMKKYELQKHVNQLEEQDAGFHSEYENSDGDVNSLCTSEEEDMDETDIIKRKRRVFYDPRCDHKTLEFDVGMRFENAHQCKDVIQRHAILNGKNIRVVRSSSRILEAKCVNGCPWKLYGSMIHKENTFAIKTLMKEHQCHREMNNRQATSTWIANEYLHKFRRNPNWSVQDLLHDLVDKYSVEVNMHKCYRAKWKALEMLRGSLHGHYAMLRPYAAELMRVDMNGRFEFMLHDDGSLKGFFICFSALKNGFLKGCRPIIGFDGCFLKTFLGGALLAAIGKDGNNQMFPICWAIVEAENEACWAWFLKLVVEELQLVDGLGWTFISDQQKGLSNAVSTLTPFAEHRNCARHIYCNWKKQYKGQTLKNIFWRAVRSTHVTSLDEVLSEMKEVDERAYMDFKEQKTHIY